MPQLTLSDKKLTRLNEQQLKKLAEAIVNHNPGSSFTMEKGNGRYLNIPVPIINFDKRLKIDIGMIRESGASVSLAEIEKLAGSDLQTEFKNGSLIIKQRKENN